MNTQNCGNCFFRSPIMGNAQICVCLRSRSLVADGDSCPDYQPRDSDTPAAPPVEPPLPSAPPVESAPQPETIEAPRVVRRPQPFSFSAWLRQVLKINRLGTSQFFLQQRLQQEAVDHNHNQER